MTSYSRKTLVSIILPVFNGEKFIAESIESCLSQTYKNIEIIIVDDCSKDSSFAIASHYSKLDERIKLFSNSENRKLPYSLNKGHDCSTGDLITWTSHDNIYESDAIEILMNEIILKKCDIAYSNVRKIDESGKVLSNVNFLTPTDLIFGNQIGSCFLYRREVFSKLCGYNTNFFLVEDYDFWLRALLFFSFSKIDKALYRYRKHSETLTSNIYKDRQFYETWKMNLKSCYFNFLKNLNKSQNIGPVSDVFVELHTAELNDFSKLVQNSTELKKILSIISLFRGLENFDNLKTRFVKRVITCLKMNEKIDGINLYNISKFSFFSYKAIDYKDFYDLLKLYLKPILSFLFRSINKSKELRIN